MSIKSLAILLPLLAAAGVDAAVAPTCTKNACLAQVTNNRNAPSPFRSSGCYSFMASTVTPPAKTVTKTVDVGFAEVTPGPACRTTAAGTSVVPLYASSCRNKAQYSSACDCLGVSMSTTTLRQCTTTSLVTSVRTRSTATATITITTTATTNGRTRTRTMTTTAGGTTVIPTASSFATAAAPTGCSNQGLSFGVFDNTAIDNQTGYFNFEPSDYTTPVYQGTLGSIQGIFFPDPLAQAVIYNQVVHSSNGFVLNHAGYIYAPMSGTYTFSATNVDDVFNFWIGENAYSGFNRENNNLDAFFFFGTIPTTTGFTNGIAGSGNYTVGLVGGLYYPIRYVFGQYNGAATFNFGITAPDGTALFGSNQPSSPYLVRFSCDGDIAPPFPSFGTAAAT